MNIISALMKENLSIPYGRKQLFYDQEEWVVTCHDYRARQPRVLCRTQIQDEAVKVLLHEDI